MDRKPNTLAHFAINAHDPDRARAFYEGVFGWSFQPWGPPGFLLIQTPGGPAGAIQKVQTEPFETRIGNFECSIAVDDVDRACEAVIAHGGELTLPKVTIPGIVDIARVKDPEGNTFSLARYH